MQTTMNIEAQETLRKISSLLFVLQDSAEHSTLPPEVYADSFEILRDLTDSVNVAVSEEVSA